MNRALDFLKSHIDVAFATVEAEKPKIRVFQIMKQVGTTLYFATSMKKEVFHQLQQNPNVEMLAMDGDISVRFSGVADFSVSDEIMREIYDTNTVLQRLYSDYKAMVYFRIEIAALDYFDLTPTPPLLIHFDLRDKTE